MNRSSRIGQRNSGCGLSRLLRLPRGSVAEVLGRQLPRAGTSVGANYRAACRGRSCKDVISRLSIVEEEADEALFWMELLIEAGLMSEKKLASLMSEGND